MAEIAVASSPPLGIGSNGHECNETSIASGSRKSQKVRRRRSCGNVPRGKVAGAGNVAGSKEPSKRAFWPVAGLSIAGRGRLRSATRRQRNVPPPADQCRYCGPLARAERENDRERSRQTMAQSRSLYPNYMFLWKAELPRLDADDVNATWELGVERLGEGKYRFIDGNDKGESQGLRPDDPLDIVSIETGTWVFSDDKTLCYYHEISLPGSVLDKNLPTGDAPTHGVEERT